MEINRCYGCMSELTAYPCEKCGYDPEKQKSPDYALYPGAILNGKYLMGRVLGQGGFGITYVGWDLALERKVAIKEYFPSGQVSRHPSTGNALQWYSSQQAIAARQSGMEMFLKEARKMSRVDDIEQVVRVRDLFQENETAYIVMDFIEGETLKDHLAKNGPMNWDEVKKIFFPAIEAMEKVHNAGLIHRDLSPDNLMLTPEGGVKILDLGAAKDLSVNSGASSMQVAKGGFSPLEQYTQRGGSGTWTDVYAMAATMYYTLTGVLPPAAVDRVESDSLRWDLPQLQATPVHAQNAIKQAMTLLAKERTQTMAVFYEQLNSSAAARHNLKEDSDAKKKRLTGKQRAFIGAACAAVILIGIGIWGMWKLEEPEARYARACSYLECGDYEKATELFADLGSYEDSSQKLVESGMQAASVLSQQGRHEEAIALLQKLPQTDGVKTTTVNITTAWASYLIKNESYSQALEKLDGVTKKTDEVNRLIKRAHYGYAETTAINEYKYEHYAAAGDYLDAPDKRRETLKNWVITILDDGDEVQAKRIHDTVQVDEEDEAMVYAAVCDRAVYMKDPSDGVWYYDDYGNEARVLLLDSLHGDHPDQDKLRALFVQFDPADNQKYVKENRELVRSLWHMGAVRDIATASDAIYATLWGTWKTKNGDYLTFSENKDGTTRFDTTLPVVAEPPGTLYYTLERRAGIDDKADMSWSNDEGKLAQIFTLRFLDVDKLEVFSYMSSQTYTLVRK